MTPSEKIAERPSTKKIQMEVGVRWLGFLDRRHAAGAADD